MVIDQRRHEKLYHALYSDVFCAEDRVYKLFKDSLDPNLRDQAGRLFEAQCDTFCRAEPDAVARRHVPQFYGPCVIDDVLDREGMSIKQGYLLAYCYVIELLHGTELKVNADEVLSRHPGSIQSPSALRSSRH
jgi:hypothetical protein